MAKVLNAQEQNWVRILTAMKRGDYLEFDSLPQNVKRPLMATAGGIYPHDDDEEEPSMSTQMDRLESLVYLMGAPAAVKSGYYGKALAAMRKAINTQISLIKQ